MTTIKLSRNFRKIFMLPLLLCGTFYADTTNAANLSGMEVKVGTLFSSSTRGRSIPGIYLGLEGSDLGGSFSTIGVESTLSYFSAYQINLFKLFHPKNNFIGKVEAGLGAGLFFYQIGYRDNLEDAPGQKKRNFAFGPSIRALWYFYGGAFVGIESMLGLRNLFFNIVLSYQDSTQLIFGIGF
ncbi:MAG: hypothetical protein HQK53_08670 [Oligoflexia bacterium]|nr:hypothetical protein [Oligoflexia bacterium]